MSSVAEKLQRKAPRKVSTKQVRLKLVYLDFWSIVKLSFLTAVCIGIIQVVVSVLVWIVLDTLQIFSAIDQTLRPIINDNSFSITATITLGQVAGFAVIVAILNVVIGTALGAVFAALYNFAARITGGLLVGFQSQ